MIQKLSNNKTPVYEILDYIITPSSPEVNTDVLVDGTTVVEMTCMLRNRAYGNARFFSSNDTNTDIPGWNQPGTWGLQFEDSGLNLSIKMLGADYSRLSDAVVARTGITYNDLNNKKLRYNLTAAGILTIFNTDDTVFRSCDVTTETDTSVTSSTPIKLFHRYLQHESINNETYVYDIKIWKNDVLIRHYLPVKRLSDNTYGLYDIVNNTFHSNEISGYSFTGASKSEKEYIYSLQTQYVNDIVINGTHINKIYNKGDIYWGNEKHIERPHTITGTSSQSFSNIYFDRTLARPGGSSFNGGYAVPVIVNGNDWFVDTNDSPQTLVGCFADNNNITSVNICNLDCTNVNSIESLFDNCRYITSCDLSRLNTSNVTLMGNVFQNCTSLTSVGDLSKWDVSKVTRMWGMFRNIAIESIDLSSWNTSSLTLIPHLFYYTTSVKSIDMSGWNTTLIQTTEYAFYNCTSLQTLNLSGWDLTSLTSQNYTFYNCSSLKDVYITVEATLNKLTNNLSSQGSNYIPSNNGKCTIHYNGTDYKWQNNRWTPQN